MIPKFDKYGNLPNGIHKASILEINTRFASNSKTRERLFKNFQKFLKLLISFKKKIKHLLINGSYVTSDKFPGDIDCILIKEDNFKFPRDINEKLLKSESLYNIHLFTFEEKKFTRYKKMISFFGHDKELRPKGLIEVQL